MKKIVIGILFWAFCITGGCLTGSLCGSSTGNLYYLTATVSDIDRENDVVAYEDEAGNLWEYEGCENWKAGDTVNLLMNDCETDDIFDDVIEAIYYKDYLGE